MAKPFFKLVGILILFTVTIKADPYTEDIRVIQGDKRAIANEFGFYLYRKDSFRDVLVDPMQVEADFLKKTAHWQVPQGISLQEQRIEIYKDVVGWTSGRYYGHGPGLKVKAYAVISVSHQSPFGYKSVSLELPGLDDLESNFGLVAKSDPNSRLHLPLTVAKLEVISKDSIWLRDIGCWLFLTAIIAAMGVSVFFNKRRHAKISNPR